MTPTQRKNIEDLESLGFNVKRLDYDSLVEELIHRYVETSSACNWTEEERFRRELKRVKQPTN